MNLFFLKPRKRSKNHPLVQYTVGDNLTASDALRHAPEMIVGLPETLLKGPGVIAGSLAVIQPPQVYQNITLPTSPYQGIPVGSLVYQGLITDEQNQQLTGMEDAQQ